MKNTFRASTFRARNFLPNTLAGAFSVIILEIPIDARIWILDLRGNIWVMDNRD